jgi:hypothetical protein
LPSFLKEVQERKFSSPVIIPVRILQASFKTTEIKLDPSGKAVILLRRLKV